MSGGLVNKFTVVFLCSGAGTTPQMSASCAGERQLHDIHIETYSQSGESYV